MDKCGNGQPDPDPYQLLGVARQADQSEIAQAWRRRVRAEHPDAQPGDVGAPARFRALARAYEMLSDPARRAAYDHAAGVPEPGLRAPRPAGTAIRVIVLSPSGSPSPPPGAAPAAARGAPLWAGPVRVEPPDAPPARDRRARQLLLAEAATRYLDDVRGWSW